MKKIINVNVHDIGFKPLFSTQAKDKKSDTVFCVYFIGVHGNFTSFSATDYNS